MGFPPPHLLPDILLKIVKRVKMSGCTGGCPHLLRQLLLEYVFPHSQQPAVGVVDDDELLRVEQVMRNDQRAQCVLRGNAAGIADHVGVSGMQSEAAFKQDSGIHACQDRQAAPGTDGKVSEVEVLYK